SHLDGGPAAGGYGGKRDAAAVTGPHDHLVEWPPQPVGCHLGKKGQVALSLRCAAGDNLRGAVGMEEYARGLRHPDPGGLYTHGDTDADRLPVLLPGADFAVAGSLGGEVEEASVITAVVNLSREAGLVRHRLGRDQVSAAELHRVESKLARKPVQHPLDTEIADRPSAAPDEA